MHRQVDAAVEQGRLELLGKQSLVSDLRQGHVAHAVAGSSDRGDRHVEPSVRRPQSGRHPLGLNQRQGAAARADDEARGAH
jgi:hypothetical protein